MQNNVSIKRHIVKICALSLTCVSLLLIQHSANAERDSYSYAGLNTTRYEYTENLPSVNIETDFHTNNIGLQTGAFVSINPSLGFYITSSTTLSESIEKETWSLDGTAIQNNSMKVSGSDTAIHLVFQRDNYQAWLTGVTFNKFDYTRFNFDVTPAGESAGVLNPNGSQGRDDFDVADSIAESQLSVSAVIGYEISKFFLTDEIDNGFKYQGQLLVGIPLLTRASNSALHDGDILQDHLNGYDGTLRLTGGWQFSKDLMLAFTLETSIYKRNRIKESLATLPKSEITIIKPSASLFWSF